MNEINDICFTIFLICAALVSIISSLYMLYYLLQSVYDEIWLYFNSSNRSDRFKKICKKLKLI